MEGIKNDGNECRHFFLPSCMGRFHIPLNRIIFIFPAHTDKSVVIVPVRRAEQNHIFTG